MDLSSEYKILLNRLAEIESSGGKFKKGQPRPKKGQVQKCTELYPKKKLKSGKPACKTYKWVTPRAKAKAKSRAKAKAKPRAKAKSRAPRNVGKCAQWEFPEGEVTKTGLPKKKCYARIKKIPSEARIEAAKRSPWIQYVAKVRRVAKEGGCEYGPIDNKAVMKIATEIRDEYHGEIGGNMDENGDTLYPDSNNIRRIYNIFSEAGEFNKYCKFESY